MMHLECSPCSRCWPDIVEHFGEADNDVIEWFDDGRDVVVERFDDDSDVVGTVKGDVIVELSDESRCGVRVAEAGSEGRRQTKINRMIGIEVFHG